MPWYIYLILAFILFVVWFIFACKNAPLVDDDYPSGHPEEKTFYDAEKQEDNN